MTGIINNPWTYVVIFLELLFEDQVLATGSGFFWQKGGAYYLVTNWHNPSGRDPTTKIALSDSAAMPDRVRFLEYEKGKNEADGDLYQINSRQLRSYSPYSRFNGICLQPRLRKPSNPQAAHSIA